MVGSSTNRALEKSGRKSQPSMDFRKKRDFQGAPKLFWWAGKETQPFGCCCCCGNNFSFALTNKNMCFFAPPKSWHSPRATAASGTYGSWRCKNETVPRWLVVGTSLVGGFWQRSIVGAQMGLGRNRFDLFTLDIPAAPTEELLTNNEHSQIESTTKPRTQRTNSHTINKKNSVQPFNDKSNNIDATENHQRRLLECRSLPVATIYKYKDLP